MLRITVISLVLVNLLLLGFQASKPEPQEVLPAAQSVAEQTGIPTLHLFDELIQAALRSRPSFVSPNA